MKNTKSAFNWIISILKKYEIPHTNLWWLCGKNLWLKKKISRYRYIDNSVNWSKKINKL